MSISETPLSRQLSQAKRHRIDDGSDELSPLLVNAVRSGMVTDDLHTFMCKMLNEFRNLQSKVGVLEDKVKTLSNENAQLKENVSQLLSANMSTSNVVDPHAAHETVEMSRAVVIGNVPESRSESPVQRAEHDFHSVSCIVNSLGVECKPTAVYRMGTVGNRPRLLKVILPTRKFQRTLVSRASWLRNSQFRGTWLRESLPKEERDRRREERNRTRDHRTHTGYHPHIPNNTYGNPQSALGTQARNLRGN